MIALALLLALQAPPPPPAVAPAAAAVPVGEQWEFDQIRFQPPADDAALKPALAAAKTMAAVADLLDRLGIRYERVRVTVAASDFPEPIRRQIEALPPDEPFAIPQPQFMTVNLLVARRPGGGMATPASRPADPAAVVLAEELLLEMKAEEQMRQVIQQGIAAMRSGAALDAQISRNDAMKLQRARNPQAWDATLARVGALQAGTMEQVLAGILPELHRRTIAAYTTNFSPAELRQLLAFYRSPIGRKSIERAPAVAAETGAWFQRTFAEQLAPAMAAIQPQVQRELGSLLQQPAR